MTQFIITYLGGNQPATPDEGRAHFAKYMQWINGLGEAVISGMNPLKDTHHVSPDGSVSMVQARKCRASPSSKQILLKLP